MHAPSDLCAVVRLLRGLVCFSQVLDSVVVCSVACHVCMRACFGWLLFVRLIQNFFSIGIGLLQMLDAALLHIHFLG